MLSFDLLAASELFFLSLERAIDVTVIWRMGEGRLLLLLLLLELVLDSRIGWEEVQSLSVWRLA